MDADQRVALLGFDAEEARELFRKDVVRPDVERIQTGRRAVVVGQLAEAAVGDQAQFVVVVEDRAAMAGQAKFLNNRSPGKILLRARSLIAWP